MNKLNFQFKPITNDIPKDEAYIVAFLETGNIPASVHICPLYLDERGIWSTLRGNDKEDFFKYENLSPLAYMDLPNIFADDYFDAMGVIGNINVLLKKYGKEFAPIFWEEIE